MESDAAVPISRVVTSGAAQVDGEPVRIGGHTFSWQIEGPAALGGIAVSNDKATWDPVVTVTGDDTGQITTRHLWARPFTAIDGSAPRKFFFQFVVFKEV
jgi:hypothetical protein